MHGHRKKVMFFIDCLHDYARRQGMQPGDVRILELGCGNGRNVSLPVAEQGFDVTGVDVHEPSIAAAKARNSLPHARFVRGDFAAFKTDQRYEVVILSDVLEHVANPKYMLEVALMHLAEHGIILISIPNGRGPAEIERLLIRIGLLKPVLRVILGIGAVKRRIMRSPTPVTVPYNNDSPHVQFFTLASFSRLVYQSGLRIERQINGFWFGADLTAYLFRFLPGLLSLNLRIADSLLAQMVSSWYFQCNRESAIKII
jgi:SAM-dependent methyltransferase